MQIIWALVRSGTYPNASRLARYLETSTKSIHRDIEFMRDRLLFDIRYDGSRFGYFTPDGPVRCPFCSRKMFHGNLVMEFGDAGSVWLEEHMVRAPALLSEDA